jgi:transposase
MYLSDLTDAQWARLGARLEPLLRQQRGSRHAGGRPRKHELRRVVDAPLYVVKTGCQLPANFPPWKAVHEQFCRFETIFKVFADGGYTGTLIGWAEEMFGFDVEVVKRNELHTFKVLPKRWIVERNFAWMGWSRRLSKDYELRPTSSETMFWISFTHTLPRRT